MNPLDNPFSKESTLSKSPGNRKKQSSKAIGSKFEKKVQSEIQETSTAKIRRGYQGDTGGGLGNSDIQGLHRWHIESKNEKRCRMPDYHRQLKEDCPKEHHPALVYASPIDGEPWISLPLSLRMEFAVSIIEAAGGTVEFSYLQDIV